MCSTSSRRVAAAAAAGAGAAAAWYLHSSIPSSRNQPQTTFSALSMGRPVQKPPLRLGDRVQIGWRAPVAHAQEGQQDKQNHHRRKPRLVVIGSGWGAVSLADALDINRFESVTLISPRNYFLFTPLLSSVASGTLGPHSIATPMHDVMRRVQRKRKNGNTDTDAEAVASFLEAEATGVDFRLRTVHCQRRADPCHQHGGDSLIEFDVPYDHLVIAVGSQANTFGTPGVEENCFFLKRNEDAIAIRNHVLDCFERANLPGVSDDTVKQLLSFVIVGGGPVGVEFAAELHDWLHTDLTKAFPHLVGHVSVKLIELADSVLNTYDEKVSVWAAEQFNRDQIELLTNTRVVAVSPASVTLFDIMTDRTCEVPYGTCVWSTGITPAPLIGTLRRTIGDLDEHQQSHRSLLVTDEHLVVRGTPQQNSSSVSIESEEQSESAEGNEESADAGSQSQSQSQSQSYVFAIGDCSTALQPRLLARFVELFRDADKSGNGYLDAAEFEAFVADAARTYPQILLYGRDVKRLFAQADTNGDGKISPAEFHSLLTLADWQLKSAPATAQAAAQQGEYVARSLNRLGSPSGQRNDLYDFPAFEYDHWGSLAFLSQGRWGGNAVVDFGDRKVFQGLAAWWAWRSIYWSKQHSWRNKFLISSDWTKGMLFGRESTRF
jgi:NADH:quinone reductase (non-electrogenic)